jgi:hypothetical protein
MADEIERAGVRNADPKLFGEFAPQGGFGGFVWLDLAAGKLPEAGHGFAGRALGEEDIALRIEERAGRDVNDTHARAYPDQPRVMILTRSPGWTRLF